MKTFSVILETENLGMAGLEDLELSLNSLQNQKFSIKNAKEVIILIGSHVSEDIQSKLKQKYPWLTLHLEKEELEYAKSKVRGAEVATSEIVIYADSDMRYEPSWLGNMLKVFETNPEADIVSGDTRLETKSAYSMALNATWMIQLLSDKIDKPVPTTFFPLNNFAIKRLDLLNSPIPYDLKLYRNKIQIWEKTLRKKGYKIFRAPGSRGFHAPPGTFIDWWYRMLIYGSDFVASADFSVDENDKIVEKKNMLGRFSKLIFLFPWKVEQLLLNSYKLLQENPSRLKYLFGSLVIGSVNIFVIELGGLIACLNRDFVLKKITAHEGLHTV